MALLGLAFLGWPAVRHGDRAVVLPTRKALALLAYLTVEGGVHSREHLTALLWPESDAAAGRATLRSTLAHLRDALDEPTAHLVATRSTLAFDAAAPHIFDITFLRGAASARGVRGWSRTGEGNRPTQADLRVLAAPLLAAASVVRGEFLAGFSLSDAPDFDDWSGLQRESFHRQATLVFDQLSQLQFHSGEIGGALETTARWIALDRLGEAAYRRLMRLHVAAGDRSAALETYDTCRALLERELQAEPSPDTVALALRIRQDRRVRQQGDWADDFRPPIAARGSVGTLPPLIGRTAEHLALAGVQGRARRGQTQAALIEGEPGIGKSRLAQEFLAWAAAQGADLLQGRAFETGAALPYHPLVDALRARLGQEEDLRALLSDTWLAELSRLLPELRDQFPELPPPLPLGDAEARLRLFEAVVRAGQALAGRAPLVWFLDDLQWADAASLDLLAYAARRWAAAAAPILLLLAARTEELAAPEGGHTTLSRGEWLDYLARDVSFTRIPLGQLSREDTGRLVAALTGAANDAQLPREIADWLFHETAGQPFYVVQTLRALAERGILQQHDDGTWTFAAASMTRTAPLVPDGVRALIDSRLARLERSARDACTAGAVVGDGGDFETLGLVAGLPEAEYLAALEGLLRRGLLRERDGRYFFTHDKIREVAYAGISGPRRRVLHRRALAALEAAAAPPGSLAHHALAGELPHDAARHSLAAGAAALQLFAVRNAIAHFEQARVLLEATTAPAAPAEQLDQLYLQLGRAYEFVNDWERASATYDVLLARSRSARRPTQECDALNRLATVRAQGSFDLAGAMGLLHEAQGAAERSGDRLRLAETNWNQAQITFYAWRLEDSLSFGERALALARPLTDRDLLARCLNIVAYNYLMLGQIEETERYAAEARAAAAVVGNRVLELDCLSIMAISRVFSGNIQSGIAVGNEGVALGRAIENPWGIANCTYPLAQGLLDFGEVDQALLIVQEGLAAARVAGHPPTIIFNLLGLGRVHRAVFALESARQLHEEALAISEALHHPMLTEWASIELTIDHALTGEWDAAARHAQRATSLRHYGQVYVGFARWCETEALLRVGEAERAAADLAQAARQGPTLPRGTLQSLRGYAVLAEAAGDRATAIEHLSAASTLARDLGLLHEQWQTDVALGDAYVRHGNADAGGAYARAAAVVRRLAAGIANRTMRESLLASAPAQRALARA